MEVAVLPVVVFGDVVMEPSDPYRGREHVIRSFLRRHAGRNCALPMCPKRGERQGPTERRLRRGKEGGLGEANGGRQSGEALRQASTYVGIPEGG